ncbi:hypothetical protein SeLEV6574_g08317 [Synchytrium endobioticum]|uniref:RING-type domain-containing protein n=1 Tax=Synchytrium endobioticum TaxID=286115 RepID=A0A507C4S1_9FUNG|nr:hypothetical protein SeLEV6574_g08317 [Synchytrium endobioticum]
MKITTLFNMQTTRWATIPLVLVLMLPHLHQTSAVGNLRGHSDPDIRYSRNRQSHDQASYRNRDHSRPPTSSVEHVSRFQDNNQDPRYSTWNAQVAGFPGEYYQPDEDSPDRQWQDQVSGVSDNNQGPRYSTWNAQVAGFPGEYYQPDEDSPDRQWQDQVSGVSDNNQGPRYSTWNAQVAGFPGEYYQPDEDSPDRQWQDQVSGVSDNNQGPRYSTWNAQVAGFPGEYYQPDEVTLAVSQLSLEDVDRGLTLGSSSGLRNQHLDGNSAEESAFADSGTYPHTRGRHGDDNDDDTDGVYNDNIYDGILREYPDFDSEGILDENPDLDTDGVYNDNIYDGILHEYPDFDSEAILDLDFDLDSDGHIHEVSNPDSHEFRYEYLDPRETDEEIFLSWSGILQPSVANPSERCGICLTDYETDEEVAKLPCDHQYHPKCIRRSLTTSINCPL